MKKKYSAPEMEILLLQTADIITASSGGTIVGGGTDSGENGGIEDNFDNWR